MDARQSGWAKLPRKPEVQHEDLAHPNVWYTAEGGIQALSEMLSDLENALL